MIYYRQYDYLDKVSAGCQRVCIVPSGTVFILNYYNEMSASE